MDELPFDRITAAIDALAGELRALDPLERNAELPTASVQGAGAVTIEATFGRLPPESLVAALPVIERRLRTLGGLKSAPSGCALTGDTSYAVSLERRPDRARPVKVSMRFGSPGRIRVERDGALTEEELGVALDLWRTFARRAPTEPSEEGLRFEELRSRVEAAVERELAGLPVGERSLAVPAVSLRHGKLEIAVPVRSAAEDQLLVVLNIVSAHARQLADPLVQSGGLSLVARFAVPGGRGAGGGVRVAIDPRRVRFEKAEAFVEEEVACALEVWRRVALRAGSDAPAPLDARARLADLGALVFEAGDPPDLAGYAEVRREVHETVVLPLLHRDRYAEVALATRGAARPSLPRAVLFEGPPGTGKTTLARRVAADAGLPLVAVPVESVMSKWYGESERRLDAIFELSATFPRSVVFLDEIDAFAGARGGAMHEATRRVLSVLLRQLHGLEAAPNVLVIGATNRKADLDPALLNRFARTVTFPLPNAAERAAILGVYARQLGAEARGALAVALDGASGRVVEDLCGAVERRWVARALAVDPHAPLGAPDAGAYGEVFAEWAAAR